MSKFSPGSWLLEPPEEGGRILANDVRQTVVYEPNCSPFNEEERANARLIASAPDLYQSLSDCVAALEHCERSLHMQIDPPLLEVARAALAKAEGK